MYYLDTIIKGDHIFKFFLMFCEMNKELQLRSFFFFFESRGNVAVLLHTATVIIQKGLKINEFFLLKV